MFEPRKKPFTGDQHIRAANHPDLLLRKILGCNPDTYDLDGMHGTPYCTAENLLLWAGIAAIGFAYSIKAPNPKHEIRNSKQSLITKV
jgi:hypothetical protein